MGFGQNFYRYLVIQVFLFVCLCLLMASLSRAAEWRISPQIGITETWHDNIRLDDKNKDGELISQIQPAINISATGRRLTLKSSYQLSYIDYYSARYRDRFSSQAVFAGDLEAIKRHLFITGNVAIGQQAIDPGNIEGFDPLAPTSNRTETRTYQFIPRLENRFGPYANSKLTYRYNHIDYETGRLDYSYSEQWRYQLSSGKWFNRLKWKGDVSKQTSREGLTDNYRALARIDYKLINDFFLYGIAVSERNNYLRITNTKGSYFYNIEAGLGWEPSRKIKIEGGGGAVLRSERLSYSDLEYEQWSWRAEIQLRPTTRTNFELGKEQAIYGDKIFFHFDHRMKKVTLSAEYGEVLSTPQQQRFQSLNSTTRASGALGNGGELSQQILNDALLIKRFEATIKWRLKKLTFNGASFYEKGEYQTLAQSHKRLGLNGGFNLPLGKRNVLSTQASTEIYYLFNPARVDRFYNLKVSFNRKFSRKLRASLAMQSQKRSTEGDFRSYTANQLIAQVNWLF